MTTAGNASDEYWRGFRDRAARTYVHPDSRQFVIVLVNDKGGGILAPPPGYVINCKGQVVKEVKA